jgi:hypothetical protein
MEFSNKNITKYGDYCKTSDVFSQNEFLSKALSFGRKRYPLETIE